MVYEVLAFANMAFEERDKSVPSDVKGVQKSAWLECSHNLGRCDNSRRKMEDIILIRRFGKQQFYTLSALMNMLIN
jgi:hypothetical protein